MATAFTLKYAKQLKQAGVPEEQAEIHAEALRGVLEQQISARFDRVDQHFSEVDKEMGDVKADLRLLKWMVGFNLAATLGVLIRLLA
jgi:hypothetical protein